MGYADQINDHRFPVKDSDPGSVERNQLHHSVALQRASARNGGQHVPSSPPSSVIAGDMVPSRAVDVPVRQIADEGPGGPDFNEEKMREAKKEHAVESGDSGMSWGRGGETETTAERGAESIPPAALASMAIDPQPGGTTSPQPDQLSRPVRPDADASAGNWNMHDIINTKIG